MYGNPEYQYQFKADIDRDIELSKQEPEQGELEEAQSMSLIYPRRGILLGRKK